MNKYLYYTAMGGLANVACQHAAATKLAKKTGHTVVCDLSFLNTHSQEGTGITPRKFTLNTLLTEPVATVEHVPDGVMHLQGEPTTLPDIESSLRIQGYFQRLSALPSFDDLRFMFTTDNDIATPGSWAGWGDFVHTISPDSIGIHVRRADYLTPNALAFHGVLGLDYYKRATEYIYLNKMLKREDTQLVVYSDDTAWCKSDLVPHLGFDNVIYAEDYLDGDAVQLYSMAYLPHFVIANSSFSWLGRLRAMAYANTSTVYPLRWFRDYLPPNMMPKEWIGV